MKSNRLIIDAHSGAVEEANMRPMSIVNTQTQTSAWLYGAWLVSLTATLGSLFIGEVLGQTPCVLCWYQRIAMFPLAWILGVACLTNDRRVGRYVFPLALVGAVIALWHSLLYAGIVKEALVPCQKNGPSCTDSAMLTFSGLPIPYLSFLSFTAILFLVSLFQFNHRHSDLQT